MVEVENSLLRVEPTETLYFEGPFYQAVTSRLTLFNLHDSPTCFKIKATVPKRYVTEPSNGLLQPNTSLNISVTIRPFCEGQLEKTEHKLVIQSIMVDEEGEVNIDQVWKDAEQWKIRQSTLVCAPRMPSQLIVEPLEQLIFESICIFSKYCSLETQNDSMASTIHLTNESRNALYYQIQCPFNELRAVPEKNVVDPGQTVNVLVSCKLENLSRAKMPPQHIVIKSLMFDRDDERCTSEPRTTDKVFYALLKCVFPMPIPVPVHQEVSTINISEDPRMMAIMAELAALKEENRRLQEQLAIKCTDMSIQPPDGYHIIGADNEEQ
ncbi:unnamed protein product [Dicrocoelium dendriticum]|nr:unnamed protein product [Dicrocoelium dendriticum]